MFGWLRKRIETASTDAIKNDLERFIISLQGAEDEEIGTMLVIANILRLNLVEMGKIPAAALDFNIPRDDDLQLKCDIFPITLNGAIKQFQKFNQPTDALGTMIWLHSVRALNYPEARMLGRQMWRELKRGFKYSTVALEQIRELGRKPLPKNISSELNFVPQGLEPKS